MISRLVYDLDVKRPTLRMILRVRIVTISRVRTTNGIWKKIKKAYHDCVSDSDLDAHVIARTKNVGGCSFLYLHKTMLSRALTNKFSRPTPRLAWLSTTPNLRADPWPLPHTPEHVASTTTPDDITPLPPLPRPNEPQETLRARLVYQSRKRGILESDLLLSTFARDQLPGMGAEEMREYDKVCVVFRPVFFFSSSISTSTFLRLFFLSLRPNLIESYVSSAPRRTRLGHLLLGDE
jgi:succinate dehydrogenase assembly factor 2